MIFELFAHSWNKQRLRLCLSIVYFHPHIMRCVIDLMTWGALRLEVVTFMLFTYGAVEYLFQPVTQKITIAFLVLV